MMHLLVAIGLLLTPRTLAQEVPIYDTIKELVEFEVQSDEAELAIQRFALGIYYDFELNTINDADETVPFEMEEEEYVDFSLQEKIGQMCGTQEGKKNHLATCTQAQELLRTIVERNAWVRGLGRELQAITTGYEAGVDGYPGKSIDVIAKFAGINHIWRAANDPFVSPIIEKLTRARSWPDEERDNIKEKAEEIASAITDLETEWEEKTDRTELTAVVWRYRHGVQYVRDEESEDCEQANEDLKNGEETDPATLMLKLRWCEIEDLAIELRDLLQKDDVDVSQDEDVIYPTHVDKENNFAIWMRYDDVGFQWYLPMEPVQPTLYHPDFADCVEDGDIRQCYDNFKDVLIRGGKYPSKMGEEERTQQPLLLGGGEVPEPSTDDEEELRKNNMVMEEPEEGKGICSHPFSKRGYLCRTIESEACDVTTEQEDQLVEAGTGGIILTRCEPERFRGDTARRTSGSDICDIGGWREALEDPEEDSIIPEDTPERQEDMQRPACSRCVVDVRCEDECIKGAGSNAGHIDSEINDGVIGVCVPKSPEFKGVAYYLMMHEMTHAQQLCGQSNLEFAERIGNLGDKAKAAESCCALEREAYFVQCKLMALDGILEKAGISIDQCASTFANFSCSTYDEDKNDDEYVCTTDNVDPEDLLERVYKAINDSVDDLGLPDTCAEALNHPRVQAMRNSLPASCEPGCQLQYANTIGNNLCYIGQCIEETHEVARDIPGRTGLTTLGQTFPWDSCEQEDPKLGAFEVPPAITGPKFPLYRPQLLLDQLDRELCQINGLPASSPPIICGFEPVERLGLPPLTFIQAADDLAQQTYQYDATALSIQYAASAIGSRVTADMFTHYMRPASQNFADLLNTMYDVLHSIGELEFPSTMCPRYADENFSCDQLQ